MRDSGQIASLTGLRGLAALWVLGFHLQFVLEQAGLSTPALDAILGPGYLGVDLFFCLSGFVIAHAYCERMATTSSSGTWITFMKRRFARIYPIHLFTLLVLLVAIPASRAIGRDFASGGDYDALGFLRHILLAHVWFPGGSESWNGPAWSIHAEWFAYAAFPLFASRLWNARSPLSLVLTIAVGYLGLIACVELALGGTYDRTYDFGILRCMAGFTAGACLWRLWRWDALQHSILRWLGQLWPALLVALLLAGAHHAVVLITAALLVPALVVARTGLFPGFLETRWLQHLGRISYALYMTHHVVLTQLVARVSPTSQQSLESAILLIAGYLLIMLIVAHVVYKCIEVPARDFLLSSRPSPARVCRG